MPLQGRDHITLCRPLSCAAAGTPVDCFMLQWRRLFSRGPSATMALLFAPLLFMTPALADVRPLTIYERIGRAPIVVLGEISDGESRLASVTTLNLIKCVIPERPANVFRIAYRLDSFLRRPWEDKIEFKKGEQTLLFLRKFTKEDGDKPEGDLYTLMWGAQGKETLPEEGWQAMVGAAGELAAILALTDFDEQARRLRDAVTSPNPIVSDSAMTEVLKQGLVEESMIEMFTKLLDAPREITRILAMRAITQVISETRIAGRSLQDTSGLSDKIRGRAATDDSAEMRVEAVRALCVLGGDDVKSFLMRLSKEDSSQMVRYEATKALTGWSNAAR